MPHKRVQEIQSVAIRFSGDSGDGMQLTGTKFTESTALAGNDLSTLPDFPAEIRAPAGTLAGVSGFQIHFASDDVRTPADQPDVLVALNPAALRANIRDVRPSGMVIVNSDAFNAKSLKLAGYDHDPLPELRGRYQLVEIPLTRLNRDALADLEISQRDADRSKNFFALGLMYWLYNRPMESTLRWLEARFKGEVLEANVRVLKAGHAFGETTDLLPVSFVVPRAKIEPGVYRNITGNTALAWGIVAATVQPKRPVFLGAYPITPASDVLHEVARFRHFGIKTFQAEDEIAAISAAIGASFAGVLGVCTTSGPGMVLKQEALGLAVMAELPLVVVDVQRAGPSTGMPTKIEQGDLLMALYGRNSDSPVPVLAPSTPGDCFYTMLEAFSLAIALHDAGDRALGLVPGEQRRALAGARRAGAAALRRHLRQRSGGLQALRARPRDAGAPLGDSGHAGPRAPHRRSLEGERLRQRLVRREEQRDDGEAARREGRAHRERDSAGRGERPASPASCSSSAGAGRTARSPPPSRRRAARGSTSRASTCAT